MYTDMYTVYTPLYVRQNWKDQTEHIVHSNDLFVHIQQHVYLLFLILLFQLLVTCDDIRHNVSALKYTTYMYKDYLKIKITFMQIGKFYAWIMFVHQASVILMEAMVKKPTNE